MLTRDGFVLDADLLTRMQTALKPPSRVAIVGAGRWAKIMCRVLAEFTPPLSSIVIVAERNYATTEEWVEERKRAEQNGYQRVSVRRSLAELLASGPVDVAIVTKMASEHYAATRSLLMAGAHVLVEKPFVLTQAEAADLVSLAQRQDRTLAVGYEFMFARAIHRLGEEIARYTPDVAQVQLVWHDCPRAEKWGVPKERDFSANVVTDLLPHILSELTVLFGEQQISNLKVTSQDGYLQADLSFAYGSTPVTVSLDKDVAQSSRRIEVTSTAGRRLVLDYTTEPGIVELDGRPLPPDEVAGAFPSSLTAELTYFFAGATGRAEVLPNAAAATLSFVETTERASAELVRRQTQEVRQWLWRDLPETMPENVGRILRHQMIDPLLRHGIIPHPKDGDALDQWVGRTFRIAHRFSRNPWLTQAEVLRDEALDPPQLTRLNAAMRDSALVQSLIVQHGLARKYWSSILPLIETGSIDAVLSGNYMFPLRLGIYAAVSCMFSCSFCGRMENPSARYTGADVTPGNAAFDRVFADMPRGISTLSLGGGLEPLTNPNLDDVIWSAKKHGHKVPLVTNGFMLTPTFVKRHDGLWDVDVLRISLYGVDEATHSAVARKPGAFNIVKNNVIEFLKARNRRGSGPRVGFNFIVLVNTTGQVLKLLDLVQEINAAVDGPGIEFLTLREDFSIPEEEGLSLGERRALVEIFQEFQDRRRRECPELNVDLGYALYPLSEGILWKGLDMVTYDGMLPRAYPQVSVAIDLLGDVYLYRDAAFPRRPGADRYIIGRISATRPLETVVREFLESGREIEPRPHDPAIMDAFDHVVTKIIWQAKADAQAGIPFAAGPIVKRVYDAGTAAARQAPTAVNYWQNLFKM
jgi:dTDP-4-amino-4,6-dideoxy-D-glucose ammonia-lyase